MHFLCSPFLQNFLGLAIAALFIAYNYFAAEAPRGQE